MDISDVKVLRRRYHLLLESLPLNQATLLALQRQGLLDNTQVHELKIVADEDMRMSKLLDELVRNPRATLTKVCFLLETRGLSWVADELQAEYMRETGKMDIDGYIQKEADMLVQRLLPGGEQGVNDTHTKVSAAMAAHVQVTKETWMRQMRRQGKLVGEQIRLIQDDITKMGENIDDVLESQTSSMIRANMVVSQNGNVSEEELLSKSYVSSEGSEGIDGISNDGDQYVRKQAENQAKFKGKYPPVLKGMKSASSESLASSQLSDSMNKSIGSISGIFPNTMTKNRGVYFQDGEVSGKDAHYLKSDDSLKDSYDSTKSISDGNQVIQVNNQDDNTASDGGLNVTSCRTTSVKELGKKIRELSAILELVVAEQKKLREERDLCFTLLGYNPMDGRLNEVLEATLESVTSQIGLSKDEAGQAGKTAAGLQEQIRTLRKEMGKQISFKNVELENLRKEQQKMSDGNRNMNKSIEAYRHERDVLQSQTEYWKSRCEVLEKTRRLGYYYVSWLNGVRFRRQCEDGRLTDSMVAFDEDSLELKNGQLVFKESTSSIPPLSAVRIAKASGSGAATPTRQKDNSAAVTPRQKGARLTAGIDSSKVVANSKPKVSLCEVVNGATNVSSGATPRNPHMPAVANTVRAVQHKQSPGPGILASSNRKGDIADKQAWPRPLPNQPSTDTLAKQAPARTPTNPGMQQETYKKHTSSNSPADKVKNNASVHSQAPQGKTYCTCCTKCCPRGD